jgi:hypothetical protein
MAPLGPGNSVVVVAHDEGSKSFDIISVLEREPRSGSTWFSAASVLPNKEPFHAVVRELLKETGITLTGDDACATVLMSRA